MKEKQNEELEMNKRAKRKARIAQAIAGVVILLLILSAINPIKDIPIIIMISILGVDSVYIIGYVTFKISIKGIEEETSKMYVNKNISEKQYVRVIPIKAMEYEEFIIEKLQKIGKFYAQILDDEIVRIYIQFDKGENLEKFTDIDKTIFKEYFVITEENE